MSIIKIAEKVGYSWAEFRLNFCETWQEITTQTITAQTLNCSLQIPQALASYFIFIVKNKNRIKSRNFYIIPTC